MGGCKKTPCTCVSKNTVKLRESSPPNGGSVWNPQLHPRKHMYNCTSYPTCKLIRGGEMLRAHLHIILITNMMITALNAGRCLQEFGPRDRTRKRGITGFVNVWELITINRIWQRWRILLFPYSLLCCCDSLPLQASLLLVTSAIFGLNF